MQSDFPSAIAARRAQGSLFLFAFGGAWLAFYVVHFLAAKRSALVALFVFTAALLGWAWSRYTRSRPALLAQPPSAAQTRARRIFNVVNVVQWLLICTASSILVGRGLSDWLVPCIILIVGLHFLPLAYAFANRAHYVTGTLLVTLALSYPFVAVGGPASPIGSVGAAAILWASGWWALIANTSSKPTPLRGAA